MADPTSPVRLIWDRLAAISELLYESVSKGQKSGWAGNGSGSVLVEAVGPDILLFQEKGTWRSVDDREFGFSNVYRWTTLPGGDRLRLEHLRFGAEKPVYLFDLQPIREDRWVSVTPHVCSEDCYHAELLIQADSIQLEWRITGPTKDETIRYVYS